MHGEGLWFIGVIADAVADFYLLKKVTTHQVYDDNRDEATTGVKPCSIQTFYSL